MVPETHPPFPIMCLLASFCSPLFWSFVFQAASPNAIPLKCVRSSRFFILLFIFLDTIPYLRLHTKHTHTHTRSLQHYTCIWTPANLSVSPWPLSYAPDLYAQPLLDVVRHNRASDSASLPLRTSSFSWIPSFDCWQIAVSYVVTSHCQNFDVSVILPSFLLAHHVWLQVSAPSC